MFAQNLFLYRFSLSYAYSSLNNSSLFSICSTEKSPLPPKHVFSRKRPRTKQRLSATG